VTRASAFGVDHDIGPDKAYPSAVTLMAGFGATGGGDLHQILYERPTQD
jgi:hypothetical protein